MNARLLALLMFLGFLSWACAFHMLTPCTGCTDEAGKTEEGE